MDLFRVLVHHTLFVVLLLLLLATVLNGTFNNSNGTNRKLQGENSLKFRRERRRRGPTSKLVFGGSGDQLLPHVDQRLRDQLTDLLLLLVGED